MLIYPYSIPHTRSFNLLPTQLRRNHLKLKSNIQISTKLQALEEGLPRSIIKPPKYLSLTLTLNFKYLFLKTFLATRTSLLLSKRNFHLKSLRKKDTAKLLNNKCILPTQALWTWKTWRKPRVYITWRLQVATILPNNRLNQGLRWAITPFKVHTTTFTSPNNDRILWIKALEAGLKRVAERREICTRLWVIITQATNKILTKVCKTRI